MDEKTVIVDSAEGSEIKIFNTLIRKQGYKNLAEFCKQNSITYDPFRKRLYKNELFFARSDLMVKICKGFECSSEQLRYVFELAKSDIPEAIADIHIGGRMEIPAIPIANRKSGRISTSLSPEEAHILISLRMIKKLNPDGYEIATMVINTYTTQISEKLDPPKSNSDEDDSEDCDE